MVTPIRNRIWRFEGVGSWAMLHCSRVTNDLYNFARFLLSTLASVPGYLGQDNSAKSQNLLPDWSTVSLPYSALTGTGPVRRECDCIVVIISRQGWDIGAAER